MNRCKRFMIQKALYPCLDKALTLGEIFYYCSSFYNPAMNFSMRFALSFCMVAVTCA